MLAVKEEGKSCLRSLQLLRKDDIPTSPGPEPINRTVIPFEPRRQGRIDNLSMQRQMQKERGWLI